jgi:hypothetical protein
MLKRLQLKVTRSGAFSALLVYYWFLLFVGGRQGEVVERFSLWYFSLVIPINLFIAFNLQYVIFAKYKSWSLGLLWYWMLVVIVSAARGDIPTIYNTSLFVFSIIIIINSDAKVSVRLVNLLLLLSIAGSVITYLIGSNVYGFIPGQAVTSREEGLGWRVSLFPNVPESAFFSLVIFLINLVCNRGRFRRFFLALSLYFLVLSAVRTAIVALIFIAGFLLATKIVELKPRPFYKLLFVGIMLSFILLINIDLLIAVSVDLSNPVLNALLFRSEAGLQSSEEFSKVVYRGWLWRQHLSLFLDHPLFGVGTFKLGDFVYESILGDHEDIGSESFLTSWIARVGLLIVPLLVFFKNLCGRAMETGNKYLYSICIALFIFSLGYGTFLIPYNCLFLLTFGTINMAEVRGEGTVIPVSSASQVARGGPNL